MTFSSSMTLTEDPAGLNQVGEFATSRLEGRDRAVGECGESTIGVEQHPVRAEKGNGALGPSDNLIDRFHAVRLLIDHADADSHVGGQTFQDVDLPRTRRAQFQEQRPYRDRCE